MRRKNKQKEKKAREEGVVGCRLSSKLGGKVRTLTGVKVGINWGEETYVCSRALAL